MFVWLIVALVVDSTYTPPPLLLVPVARFHVIEQPSIKRLAAPSAQTAPPFPTVSFSVSVQLVRFVTELPERAATAPPLPFRVVAKLKRNSQLLLAV
jgi:hypothetical protein